MVSRSMRDRGLRVPPVTLLLPVAFIAVALAAAVLFPEDAAASRRSGLAGNLFIEDPDDIFIFPPVVVRYANRVVIDHFAPANGTGGGELGNGTLLFGKNDWALNLSVHRSDYLNGVVAGFWSGNDRGLFGPRFNPDLNGPTNRDPDALQWFDVGFGTQLGEVQVGGRLASGLDAQNTETQPTTGSGAESKNTARVLSLQGGISWPQQLDLTGEISFGSSEASNTAPDPDQVAKGSVSEVAFGARAFKESDDFDWGFLGAFAHSGSDYDTTIAGQVETFDESINMWMFGVGPVWDDEAEDWQVAGYATVESQTRSFDPPGDRNKQEQRFFTLPGFRFAAERRLWRTIWVRGGVRSDYFFGRTENEAPAATSVSFDREYRFRWTAGFSTEVSRFRFEGAINEPWVTSGPHFVSRSSELMAVATATYLWGKSAR